MNRGYMPADVHMNAGYMPPYMDVNRAIRTACDFCHNKRIKCKREKGSLKCTQCFQRGQECKFSPKEKTGPKPRVRGSESNSKGGNSSPKPKTKSIQSNTSPEGYQHVLKVDGVEKRSSAMRSSGDSRREDDNYIHPTSQPIPEPLLPSIGSMQQYHPYGEDEDTASQQMPFSQEVNDIEVQKLEDKYLKAYMGSIAQLLPFCENTILLQALASRRANNNTPPNQNSVGQAYLSAAIAIGALMFHDPCCDYYHHECRTQLMKAFPNSHPSAASVLSMLGFYWLCRGENPKKDIYLQYARRGLSNCTVPTHLRLIMDHLDYDNRTTLRPDAQSMSAQYRILHAVSCLLCDMSRLMNQMLGSVFAQAYCQELHDCSVMLEEEVTGSYQIELPRLLCYSLRAFLLVLLGMKKEAIMTLAKTPSLLESNPIIVKALPLSWDTSVISGTLAFILGMKAEYQAIYNIVDAERNTCIASSWMCRLPDPQSSLDSFLSHECQSSSNICSIICHIGHITSCGAVSYYDPDVQANQANARMQDEFSLAPLPDLPGFPIEPSPTGNTGGREGNGEANPNPDETRSSRETKGATDGDSTMGGMPLSIGDMKDIYVGPSDSLSEQMMNFVVQNQQSYGVDDGKVSLQSLMEDDTKHRIPSCWKNMSFGSFGSYASGRRHGARTSTGLSEVGMGILDDAEFDFYYLQTAFDGWTERNPNEGPVSHITSENALQEPNNLTRT